MSLYTTNGTLLATMQAQHAETLQRLTAQDGALAELAAGVDALSDTIAAARKELGDAIAALTPAPCPAPPPVVVVNPPPAPAPLPSDPAPAGRILFDTRAGGAQDLQRMATAADVANMLGKGNYSTLPNSWTPTWGFTKDLDGRGTRGILIPWAAKPAGTFGDVAQLLTVELKNFLAGGPMPRRFVVQWKSWLGRTRTGAGTPGGADAIGAIGAFQWHNPADPVKNAAGKRIRLFRDLPDATRYTRGFDILYHGHETGLACYAELASSSPLFPSEQNAYGAIFPGVDPAPWINQVVTTTLAIEPSSSDAAADGSVRVWMQAAKVLDLTAKAALGVPGFSGFEFPMIFRSPAFDQTEYWWDVVAWEPAVLP